MDFGGWIAHDKFFEIFMVLADQQSALWNQGVGRDLHFCGEASIITYIGCKKIYILNALSNLRVQSLNTTNYGIFGQCSTEMWKVADTW